MSSFITLSLVAALSFLFGMSYQDCRERRCRQRDGKNESELDFYISTQSKSIPLTQKPNLEWYDHGM